MLSYFEVRPNARLEASSRLWTPFQDAVAAWRARPSPKRFLPITDWVSELTVAGILIKSLRSLSANTNHGSPVSKDVWIPASGSTSGKTATPVKTVQPQTDDSDENWEKYKERCDLFTPGADFSTVCADEEIDLPFAKIHVCKGHGIPCAVRNSIGALESGPLGSVLD